MGIEVFIGVKNIMISLSSHEFEKAAKDLIELTSSYLEEKFVFLGRTTETTFSILKIQKNDVDCELGEGIKIDLTDSLCHLIFNSKKPVILNDIDKDEAAKQIPVVSEANIRSYLGVPIFLKDGELFGTLCAVDSKLSSFSEKDVQILEKLAYFFSYVLELEKLAMHDGLTELYNRNFFESVIAQSIQYGTIMLLDLDGFKSVNDQYGHETGDEVIKKVADCIKKIVFEDDYAIRMGGDEFVIFFSNVYSMEKINEMAEQLLYGIMSVSVPNTNVSITASIGIVININSEEDLSVILRHADIALYQAKEKGKNNYQLFQE
ncbi:sensor domain-containing diguanylate cyclase [Jeotgalibacillus soli]|uniref:GGDEF domain-containing protein n=1 Tax=Jeotgalibacillus soli TaxID=889306 RepID=A0A0C2RQ01_9BACL|nr:sensor domain-containing diguanylate cyclase [Jeotgalibacillus soli]KIL43844.1 hypothetical protein KP78_36680 [Jeotgalibacillus soli]